ncbi:MAG: ferritin, partial [Acidobacteria bacterium]|nr:ferritin [Acidobacteriota bacterium]
AAAELQAAYRYLYLSQVASSMHGREVAENFEKMAGSEWTHVGTFLKRIVQLGGKPFERLAEADKLSYGNYKAPPKVDTDWKKMLKDSIASEQEAIEFYNDLLERVRDTDPVTAHIVREALEDEVEDEHELASLLE